MAGQTIRVRTPELAVAAQAIGQAASAARAAHGAAGAAQGDIGAFGGEPIGAAFATMCVHAQQATAELAGTLDGFADKVAKTSLGYVTTDKGIIPVDRLHGFHP